jgi:hypothetical protein
VPEKSVKAIAFAAFATAVFLVLSTLSSITPAQAQTGCVPVVVSGNIASVPGGSFSVVVPPGTPSGSFTACNNGNGTGTLSGPLVPGGSCTGPTPKSTNQAAFLAAISACFSTPGAAPLTQSADAARNASQIGLTVIQSQNQTIRDEIRFRLRWLRRFRDHALGFAGEPEDGGHTAASDLPWSMTSFTARNAKASVYKAPPKAQEALSVYYSTWAVGFYDNERRDETFAGADIGRRTATAGGLGGVLAILTGLPFGQPDDILIVGAFGGDTTSHLRTNSGPTTNVNGPGAGVNAIWMRGGFSADTTLKADFFTLSPSTLAPTELGMSTYNSLTNVNYRIEKGNWWVEPTGGFGYTSTQWDTATNAMGFVDGHTIRLSGGSRVGTSWDWNSVKVEPVLGLFVYDDVIVRGGNLATAVASPLVRTDEGKLFGQATGKMKFDWTERFSSYLEGEVRGRSGVLGAAGRLGLTYVWGAT